MYTYMNYYRSSESFMTLNTTRICGVNPADSSIAISKMAFTNMQPNTIILINQDEIYNGIAATPLVHFPYNSSVLLTPGNMLYHQTLDEIMRLNPKGHKGIHVFLVGNIGCNVEQQLSHMGLKTKRISGHDHYEVACKVPDFREDFKNVLIISGEDYREGIAASYWSAHHGDPILFVKKESIPRCTLETLRKLHHINIFIIGSTNTISKSVEKNLSKLSNVKFIDRITGNSPYEVAVNFAKYKTSYGEFGWGRNYKEGHAFTFGSLGNPMEIIPGVAFAHMGKHTPLLLIKENEVPSVVEDYIKQVKPVPPKDMPKPPFMHGFILGSINQISYLAQVKLEKVLSIDDEIMEDKMKEMMEKNIH